MSEYSSAHAAELLKELADFLDATEPPPLRLRGGRVGYAGQPPAPPPSAAAIARSDEDQRRRLARRDAFAQAKQSGLEERVLALAVAAGVLRAEVSPLDSISGAHRWIAQDRTRARQAAAWLRARCETTPAPTPAQPIRERKPKTARGVKRATNDYIGLLMPVKNQNPAATFTKAAKEIGVAISTLTRLHTNDADFRSWWDSFDGQPTTTHPNSRRSAHTTAARIRQRGGDDRD